MVKVSVKIPSQERVKIGEYYHSASRSRKGFDYGGGKEISEEEKDQREPRKNG